MAKLLERSVETIVEVNKGAVWPKLFAHFLAGDDFSGPLQQHGEDAEGLLLQRHPASVPEELSRRRIDLEQAKTQAGVPIGRISHVTTSPRTRPKVYHVLCSYRWLVRSAAKSLGERGF
jgi:hypothetical protein